MLKKFSDWFSSQIQSTQPEQQSHTVELATAVLLQEIMRADNSRDENEQQALKQVLEQKFTLTQTELQTLVARSEHQAEEAADLVQFTRIINECCSAEQKRAILEGLWRVAFADGTLDANEEHLIRRIADLLHLPHSQFIKSKLAVQEDS